MSKPLAAASFVSIMMLFSLCAVAQDSRDVLRAFGKLEAHIETGINYRDYTSELANANYELKLFFESGGDLSVAKALAKALEKHSLASALWQLKVSGGKWSEFVSPESTHGKSLLALYPAAAKQVQEGGAMIRNMLDIDYLLPFFWRDAAADVQAAKSLTKKRSP